MVLGRVKYFIDESYHNKLESQMYRFKIFESPAIALEGRDEREYLNLLK